MEVKIKYPEIGRRLRDRLSTIPIPEGRKKVTNKHISEKTGIPESTIGRYLKGQIRPEGDYLITLTQFFGITPDWLYGKEKNENKAKTNGGPESEVVGSGQPENLPERDMDLIEKYADAKVEIALLKKELELEREKK